MDNGQKTVTINGAEKAITIPASFATLRDLLLASRNVSNPYRAFYAALGLCVQFRPALGLAYKGDPIGYGGDVMDELHGRAKAAGVDLRSAVNELDAAALTCWNLCAQAYLPDSEVSDAEDFTEAIAEVSTS